MKNLPDPLLEYNFIGINNNIVKKNKTKTSQLNKQKYQNNNKCCNINRVLPECVFITIIFYFPSFFPLMSHISAVLPYFLRKRCKYTQKGKKQGFIISLPLLDAVIDVNVTF